MPGAEAMNEGDHRNRPEGPGGVERELHAFTAC